jgi:hypothetical protein
MKGSVCLKAFGDYRTQNSDLCVSELLDDPYQIT